MQRDLLFEKLSSGLFFEKLSTGETVATATVSSNEQYYKLKEQREIVFQKWSTIVNN
jgi:hypothetical protein